MSRHTMQLTLDPSDPYEAQVLGMVAHLHKTARSALKTWFLQQCIQGLGSDAPELMAMRLRQAVLAGGRASMFVPTPLPPVTSAPDGSKAPMPDPPAELLCGREAQLEINGVPIKPMRSEDAVGSSDEDTEPPKSGLFCG